MKNITTHAVWPCLVCKRHPPPPSSNIWRQMESRISHEKLARETKEYAYCACFRLLTKIEGKSIKHKEDMTWGVQVQHRGEKAFRLADAILCLRRKYPILYPSKSQTCTDTTLLTNHCFSPGFFNPVATSTNVAPNNPSCFAVKQLVEQKAPSVCTGL